MKKREKGKEKQYDLPYDIKAAGKNIKLGNGKGKGKHYHLPYAREDRIL